MFWLPDVVLRSSVSCAEQMIEPAQRAMGSVGRAVGAAELVGGHCPAVLELARGPAGARRIDIKRKLRTSFGLVGVNATRIREGPGTSTARPCVIHSMLSSKCVVSVTAEAGKGAA
jgi:hypothetical protein